MTKSKQHSANLSSNRSRSIKKEEYQTLLETDKFRIEKITSRGNRTPRGKWYDQEKNEWVMVLKGAAQLRFAGCKKRVGMKPGSRITIPAHRRHRVEWTDPEQETIWLAVFY